MIAIKTKRKRGGIILLVVLGVLALFSILAVTYLTFASNSRQAAFNTARREFHNPNPEFLLEEAFGQILRGTTDPSSALFRHDILGDYYGYQSPVMGVDGRFSESLEVRALPPMLLNLFSSGRDRGVLLVGGNVVKVPIRFDAVQPFVPNNIVQNFPPELENIYNAELNQSGTRTTLSSPYNLDDVFAGRTVTIKDGPLANTTFRCLRWAGFRDRNGPENSIRYSLYLDLDSAQLPSSVILDDGSVVETASLLSPNSGGSEYSAACLFYNRGANTFWGSNVNNTFLQAGQPGSDDEPYRLVINPTPRNGAGVYTTAQTSQLNLPAALQPNYATWWTPASPPQLLGNADEPYDAPDLENMFLAYRGRDLAGNTINIPSFHRPSLINHLRNQFSSNPAQLLTAIRGATLRPLPVLAPNLPLVDPNTTFTGGNSEFILRVPSNAVRATMLANALTDGPWDVDNDGDGENDSLWLDAKLPLVTAEDGTRLRPLIAVQIEDLGSKFNVNAHGSQAHLSPDLHAMVNGPLAGRLPGQTPGPVALPAGRGYGPAEVLPLLTANGIDGQGRIIPGGNLSQSITALMNSRYLNAAGNETAPGGLTNEYADEFKSPNQPQVHSRNSVHGLPLDRHGRGILATDASGNLISAYAGAPLTGVTPTADEVVNDPYEFSPTADLSGDQRFALVDYEKLIERNRWQQYLQPSGIELSIGNLLNTDSLLAQVVTPVSSADVGPPQQPPTELARDPRIKIDAGAATIPPGGTLPPIDASRRPAMLVESLLARVIGDPGNSFARVRTGNPAVIDEQDIQLAQMLLAPELRAGGQLNINRPFGNGIDDNGNGIIDEPLESVLEASYAGIGVPPEYNLSPVPVTFRPNGLPESPREAMARHLYCLVMLLTNDADVQKERWRADTANIPSGPELDRFIARRVAQWAVNVVDYRDSDSIMTRFVYDFNPINGWNTNPANTTDPTNPPEIAEVWGCEHPELLFMESLAFHDVRVKDTNLEAGGDLKADEDAPQNTDQIRKPEGSAFLELYNPRPRTTVAQLNHEALPAELYDFSGAVPALNLGLLAPASAGPNGPMPVWRIAISEPHFDPNEQPNRHRTTFPDSASFEPIGRDELQLAGAPADLDLERFVIFVRPDPLQRDELDGVANAYGVDTSALFANLTSTAPDAAQLPLGTFLTIAPRTVTHLGSLADGGTPLGPSPQRFETILDRGVLHYNINDMRTTPETVTEDAGNANLDTQDSKVFIAQAFTPPGWNITNRERGEIFGADDFGIGFNISEPLPGLVYYRKPTDFLMGPTGAFTRRDGYWNYTSGASSDGTTPADDPSDLNNNFPIRVITELLMRTADPAEPYLGIVDEYRTAFLQRLANPLLPFQDNPTLPNFNPYRTVDWITMDLNVFSGDESESTVIGRGATPRYAQDSRQRNGANRDGSDNQLLFSNRLNLPATGQLQQPIAIGSPNYNVDMGVAHQSLGYLNEGYGGRISRQVASDAFLDYVGQPITSFVAHPWLNRPYASPLELMMVPATSQTRLFEEFSVANTGNVYTAGNFDDFRAPFLHLMNFFDGREVTDITAVGNDGDHAHLYRIFEYLTTGPKFRGQSEPKAPSWTNGDLGITDPDVLLARNFWSSSFRFPFNAPISTTETGRINLNTLGDQRVFAGMTWNHLPPNERAVAASGLWNLFGAARRNHTIPGNNSWTQFPRPFTSSMTDGTRLDPANSMAPDQNPLIDGSILAGAGTFDNVDNATPFFARSTTGLHDNVDTNALLRYQSLMRMSNLTTDNANTFVIRITLGFFEFNDTTGLGKEHLVDFGRNKRYRATYVIDRSIPVNYETGVDNDTRNCILFERFYRD
ncbi:hypothetical protein SH139x_001465 [Planctomycetaceae bacterium SH139]